MASVLGDALVAAAELVPRLALFLIIVLPGIVMTRLAGRAVGGVLARVGFDLAVERGGLGRALAGSTMDASDIVAKLIRITLLLFVLQLAYGVWGPNPMSVFLSEVIRFLPSLALAIITLVVADTVAATLKGVLQDTLGGLSYGRRVSDIASLFVLFLGIVAALDQVGAASTVTTPVLVALLATIGGGVGGGLVRPAQQRWECYLTAVARETPGSGPRSRGNPASRGHAAEAARTPGATADHPRGPTAISR